MLVANLEGAVGRVWVEQVVLDPPGPRVDVVVDYQPEGSDIGDVDEGVVALAELPGSHVHEGRHQERVVLVLVPGEPVAAQQLVVAQGEGQDLRRADSLVPDRARVQDPEPVAFVDLLQRKTCLGQFQPL